MATPNAAARQLFRDLFTAFNDREWSAVGELLQDLTTAYPDAQIAVEELFAADERVAARVEIIGTMTESGSEETVALSGVTHGRIENGRIAGNLTVYRELGRCDTPWANRKRI